MSALAHRQQEPEQQDAAVGLTPKGISPASNLPVRQGSVARSTASDESFTLAPAAPASKAHEQSAPLPVVDHVEDAPVPEQALHPIESPGVAARTVSGVMLSPAELGLPEEPLLRSMDLRGVAEYIQRKGVTRVVCMCGAGISVAAGIPDFRSPGTGLYDNLQKYKLPHPQAVFELDFFRRNPEPFYQLAKELFPSRFQPTAAHHFIRLLHDKGLLLRCYSQNIDSLEAVAGLPADKLIAAHGNFDSAKCIACGQKGDMAAFKECALAGEVCRCATCGGYVKPDIVFFGENLPDRFFLHKYPDLSSAELLIIMGTSLVVHPFASLTDDVPEGCPRVLINREAVGEIPAAMHELGYRNGLWFGDGNLRDVKALGECDDMLRQFAEHLGWADDLHMLIDGHTAAAGEANLGAARGEGGAAEAPVLDIPAEKAAAEAAEGARTIGKDGEAGVAALAEALGGVHIRGGASA